MTSKTIYWVAIAALALMVAACATSPETYETEGAKLDAVAATVASGVEAGSFNGGLLVRHGDDIAYEGAFGSAGSGAANTTTTRFDTASMGKSMGKMYTGVLFARLVQDTGYDLSATLDEVLPHYGDPLVTATITLSHLLTHSSGIPDFGSFDFINKVTAERGITFDEYWSILEDGGQGALSVFEDRDLEFSPGSRFGYSNSGFLVLGLAYEAITGITYCEAVESQIFAVAGMQDSTCGGSFGGGETTLSDMLDFGDALLGFELADAEHTELLLTEHIDSDDGGYGFGFSVDAAGTHRVVGHKGGAAESKAQLLLFPETGYRAIEVRPW